MMSRRTPYRGFLLVEMVVYTAVAAVLLTVIATCVVAMMRARQKDVAIQEVESQGLEAMLVMTTALKNGQTVVTPSTSAFATTLSVSTSTASVSPMVFSLSNKALVETDGAGASVPLTSKRVVVSNLSFANYATSTTYGSVRIQFTLGYASTTSRFDTNYSQTFYGTGSIHRPPQ